MSQSLIPGHITTLPFLYYNSSSSYNTVTLNATGETLYMVGQIMLENPLSGSKTISSAGGGSIVWRAGTVTFANGSSVFDIGIQDVSTASSPAQGDGTFDVLASFTGGGGGITTAATNSSTMTSGTKTIAHGDLISIGFAMTTRGGADSVIVSFGGAGSTLASTTGMPVITNNTSGSYARFAGLPNAYIVFDDGTIGWFYGGSYISSLNNSLSIASNTGTADEYGNLLYYGATFSAIGIQMVSAIANAADFEAVLYSDPLGTPVAERTITVDATQIGATTTALYTYLFSSPFTLRSNTTYAVAIRPTTTTSLTLYYLDNNSSVGGKTGYPNSNCYAVRRLDNAGAFSDYNGGTAKTRAMYICLVGSSLEQGVNSGNYRIGI